MSYSVKLHWARNVCHGLMEPICGLVTFVRSDIYTNDISVKVTGDSQSLY
jgi:hypothetical protein